MIRWVSAKGIGSSDDSSSGCTWTGPPDDPMVYFWRASDESVKGSHGRMKHRMIRRLWGGDRRTKHIYFEIVQRGFGKNVFSTGRSNGTIGQNTAWSDDHRMKRQSNFRQGAMAICVSKGGYRASSVWLALAHLNNKLSHLGLLSKRVKNVAQLGS